MAIEICVERGESTSECLKEGYIQRMNPDNMFDNIGSLPMAFIGIIGFGILYSILKEKIN